VWPDCSQCSVVRRQGGARTWFSRSCATKFNMALALVASLVGVALSSSVSTAGWKPVVTTTDEERATVLPFTVALKPSNLAQLDALLEAVSVRSHPHDGDPSACHFVPSPTCHCPSTTTIHQVRALVVAQYVHVHAGAVANVPASGLLRLGFRDDTGHLKQALITSSHALLARALFIFLPCTCACTHAGSRQPAVRAVPHLSRGDPTHRNGSRHCHTGPRGACSGIMCRSRRFTSVCTFFSSRPWQPRVGCDWTCLLTVRPPPTPPHHPLRPSTFTP
jgi:hypothetical protein